MPVDKPSERHDARRVDSDVARRRFPARVFARHCVECPLTIVMSRMYEWLLVVGQFFVCVGVALGKYLGGLKGRETGAVCCGQDILDQLRAMRTTVRNQRLVAIKRTDVAEAIRNASEWLGSFWGSNPMG